VISMMPTQGGFDFGSELPYVGMNFCDAGSRVQLKAFFEPRVDKFVGARHSLDQVLEAIDLCIASKAAQAPGVAAFMAKY
jgi:alanyl aminopeptidase